MVYRNTRWVISGGLWKLHTTRFCRHRPTSALQCENSFRDRNLYVNTGSQVRVVNALHSLLNQLTPWPNENADITWGQNVEPQVTPILNPSVEQTVSDENEALNRSNIQEYTVNQNQPSSTRNTTEIYASSHHSSLQVMFKAYGDNGDKCSRSPSENFNRKLALFTERCQQNSLYDDEHIRAFSVILPGHALKFYLDSLKGKYSSLDDIYVAIGRRFISEERSHALIREWDKISLSKMISENATKPKTSVWTPL